MSKLCVGSFVVGAVLGAAVSYILCRHKHKKEMAKKIKALGDMKDFVAEYKNSKNSEAEKPEETNTVENSNDNANDILQNLDSDKEVCSIDSGEPAEEITNDSDDIYHDYSITINEESYDEVPYEVADDHPYNITEEQYFEEGNFKKVHLMVYDEADKACDADTGEEVDDWHDILGDLEYGTLQPWYETRDGFFIRNPLNHTDYWATMSVFDWLEGGEKD